jgi:hypothetical protein
MKIKSNLVYVAVFVFLIVVFEVFIGNSYPEIIEVQLEELRNDDSVLREIGGYDSFEYSYNKNKMNSDTLDFTIIVYGTRRKVVKKTTAIKKDEEWMTLESIVDYKDLP